MNAIILLFIGEKLTVITVQFITQYGKSALTGSNVREDYQM